MFEHELRQPHATVVTANNVQMRAELNTREPATTQLCKSLASNTGLRGARLQNGVVLCGAVAHSRVPLHCEAKSVLQQLSPSPAIHTAAKHRLVQTQQ